MTKRNELIPEEAIAIARRAAEFRVDSEIRVLRTRLDDDDKLPRDFDRKATDLRFNIVSERPSSVLSALRDDSDEAAPHAGQVDYSRYANNLKNIASTISDVADGSTLPAKNVKKVAEAYVEAFHGALKGMLPDVAQHLSFGDRVKR